METTQAGQPLDLSQVPGVVIHHSPADTKQYIGSPGIAILPDGSYLASHDYFGPGSTFDSEAETRVYHSADLGKTWEARACILGQFWSSLFVHDEAVYLIGVNRAGGDIVIRKSTDDGHTWSVPEDEHTGVLASSRNYHTAPVPVVTHRGRIWRVFENTVPDTPSGTQALDAFVMSAPVDANLLEAAQWRQSNRLSNLDAKLHWWLEGNVAITPDDSLVAMMRVVDPRRFEMGGKVARLRIEETGRRLELDVTTPLIDLPGGSKMFVIRYDPVSGLYWAISNAVLEPLRIETTPHEFLLEEKTRNTQVLLASGDLIDWEIRTLVLYHPDTVKHGFQYVNWLIDGEDIVAVSRTAYDDGLGGANSQHDANYLTFHRIEAFRNRTMSMEEIQQIITSGDVFDIETK